MLLLLVLPLLVLIGRASSWDSLPTSARLGSAIWLSLSTSGISIAIILLLGTPLAYILARWQFRARRFLTVIIQLPIVLPPAVAGLALLLTFGRRGFLGETLQSWGITIPFTALAVIIAQVFVSAPFYLRAAQTAFASVPKELEDAAEVDGANGWILFWRITLPLSVRYLSAGLVLSWARAIGEFGATILFAGSLQGQTQTMPLLVYDVFQTDIDAAIEVSLILIIIALIALFFSQWLSRDNN